VEASVSVTEPGLELSLFQRNHLASVVKEALNNVAKHAAATKVSIGFSRSGGDYLLSVEDDGVGLAGAGEAGINAAGRGGALADAGASAFAGGSGLGIMRERAASLGGSLELRTWPGSGTHVLLRMPAQGPATATALGGGKGAGTA